jgi:hypothetical protein
MPESIVVGSVVDVVPVRVPSLVPLVGKVVVEPVGCGSHTPGVGLGVGVGAPPLSTGVGVAVGDGIGVGAGIGSTGVAVALFTLMTGFKRQPPLP